MGVLRLRALGLSFLLVIALLIALAIATYNRAFSDDVIITLQSDHVGNQLQDSSDVKIRGLIVGQVDDVQSHGTGATVTLGIKPEYVGQIPANVSARLLPKTLFGERYVSLLIPAHPAGPIKAGDVIAQDRTQTSIELEKVLSDVLPLLRTLQPDKLNATLTAIATALAGRGDQIGATLTDLGSYLGELNKQLPTIQADIAGLADVAATYDGAAGDILDVLSNLSVTSSTVVDQKDMLAKTFSGVTAAAGTLQDFVATNSARLIGVTSNSKPLLALLAKYAPEYTCLLQGLAAAAPRLNEAFGPADHPALHLTIEVIIDRGQYMQGEQPKVGSTHGPNCYGLPNPPYSQANPFPGPNPFPYDGSRPPAGTPAEGGAAPASDSAGGGSPVPGGLLDGVALSGSPAELQYVKALVGLHEGVEPDQVLDSTATIAAPVLRGTTVELGR